MGKVKRFGNIWISGAVFIIVVIPLGLLFRQIWSPLLTVVGGYLLIDFLASHSLLSDEKGQAYVAFPYKMFGRFWFKKVSEIVAAFALVIIILLTAGVADGFILLVKWVDRFIPPVVSVLLWSFWEGAFLIENLLRAHKEPVSPREMSQG